MIEIIKDKKTWSNLLTLVENSDFYFTYDYHHSSKKINEHPILVKYTDENTLFLLPLLLRDIDNTDYKDATSVYGYAGVLTNKPYTINQKEEFQKELHNFFFNEKVVSVFSRLHPFFDYQEDLLSNLGQIIIRGKVVYIDLKDTLENQRAKFNRRLKTHLNKSRKLCTVIKGNITNDLDTFIDLYHENMRRVDADESYFFNQDYFRALFNSNEFDAELLLSVHNVSKTIIGGAIFIKKGTIVQYHLSGLNEDYFDLQSIKLIIDEMRIKATNEEYSFLNLGGGRGSDEDSLFRFKSNFSKDFKEFKLWKYIVNEKIYNELTKTKIDKDFKLDEENNFFPAYRSPILLIS
tara:strand:- start:3106 stop:4152 length:1047 start_codon:yes stop_codon:yes gene_type:complete